MEMTFVSNENGLKFNVNDANTASLLRNPEKKAFLYEEKEEGNHKQSGGKGKKAADNVLEIA